MEIDAIALVILLKVSFSSLIYQLERKIGGVATRSSSWLSGTVFKSVQDTFLDWCQHLAAVPVVWHTAHT